MFQQRQPSPDALQMLQKENSQLTERVTSLSQEKASLRQTLASLERQLRRTESELAKVSTGLENRPVGDLTSNSKVGTGTGVGWRLSIAFAATC